MNGAFEIAAIGLDAQQEALDRIANNIANVVEFEIVIIRYIARA